MRSRPQNHYAQLINYRRYEITILKAIEDFKHHQKTSLKKRTQEGYKRLLKSFQSEYGNREIESVKAEGLCRFLEEGNGSFSPQGAD